jgi:Spy/CpxP family protein refolding chaperone
MLYTRPLLLAQKKETCFKQHKPHYSKRRHKMKLTLKHLFSISTAMIMILVFSIPVIAGQHERGRNDGYWGQGQKRHAMNYSRLWEDPDVVKELGLSNEQVEKIKQADFSFREEHIKQKAELEQYRLELEKAFSSEPVEKAAVLKSAEKISDIRGKMFLSKTEYRLDLKSLLTPDQNKKLDTCKKQRFGKYGKNKKQNEHRRGGSSE